LKNKKILSDSQKKVSTLFFDGAGTLFHVKGSVGQIYSEVARKYEIKLSPEVLETEFKKAFRSSPPMAFPGLKKNLIHHREKEWWKNLVIRALNGMVFPRFNSFFDELFERFRGNSGWVLFSETRGVLRILKDKGYHLGIISNFDSRIYDVCRALDIDSFFDSITISSEVGAAKPNSKIFQVALSKHQVEPECALHVGDSPEEDIEGARSVGIFPFLINRSGSFSKTGESSNPKTNEPFFQVIHDLKGVISFLSQ